MTERIERVKRYLEERRHRAFRRELTGEELDEILPAIRDRSLSWMRRHTLRLKLFLERETPVLLPDTHIYGMRTIVSFPDIISAEEMAELM